MTASKRKKDRVNKLNKKFFSQGSSADTSPGICTCCIQRNHNHKIDFSDDAKLSSRTDMFREALAAMWRERHKTLMPGQQKDISAVVEWQLQNSDLTIVLKTLRDAYKKMSVHDEVKTFMPMEGFDLGNLDDVATEYEGRCELYQDAAEAHLAGLARTVGHFASVAGDEKVSPNDRLEAKLKIHIADIDSKIVVPLNACLLQVQLFNVEKRWGITEESYQELTTNDLKRRGQLPVEGEPSFRQKLNIPFKPALEAAEPTSNPGDKKKKKQLSATEAMKQIQRNCKLAIKEMQEIDKTLRRLEEPVKMPVVPKSFTYAKIPVPEDLPHHIRQRFFDADFACQQILPLQADASGQLLEVRCAIVAWCCAGTDIWKAGKDRIHEVPIFREYEYTRVSLFAMLSVMARQEVKIVEFYSSEGSPDFPSEMAEIFTLDSMSPEEFEKDWETRVLKVHKLYPSVDDLRTALDTILKDTPKTDISKTKWWQCLV